jgi:hypothetical protein
VKDRTVNLFNTVKKTLASGKGGEAAVKIEPNGSFLSLVDGIVDNIKVLEDAINALGLKEEVKIGICFQGDAMWQ